MNTYRTKPLVVRSAEDYATENLYSLSDLYKGEEHRVCVPYLHPTEVNILGTTKYLSSKQICTSNYREAILTPEEVKQYRVQMFNPEYATVDYEQSLERRKKFIEATTKLEEELRTIFTDKPDIKKLDALDGLLVCEAKTFLDKMVENIAKRKTPKTTLQYEALMELRKQPVITCEV